MNTRTYHRSSVQAFPKTTEYACAVERVSQHRTSDFAFAFALAVVALLVCALGVKGLLFGAMQ